MGSLEVLEEKRTHVDVMHAQLVGDIRRSAASLLWRDDNLTASQQVSAIWPQQQPRALARQRSEHP